MQRILTKETLVLPGTARASSSIVIEAGIIVAIDSPTAGPDGLDLEGDLLVPGLVDLHSDHLERHVAPRPGVAWDPFAAAIAHDAQMIGAGITTSLDSLSLTGAKNGLDRGAIIHALVDGLTRAADLGALRAEHLLHLRCEVTEAGIVEHLEPLAGNRLLRLVSMMDHAPGERQFRSVEIWLERHRTSTGLDEAQLAALMARQIEARATFAPVNRARLASLCRDRGLALASHDDATVAHIEEAARCGAAIAEFLVAEVAARAARRLGLSVVMGSPNLVRGGSHVGNFSAVDCARAGLLDILASDYVPASLLHGAFLLTRDPIAFDLPAAIAAVTATPRPSFGIRPASPCLGADVEGPRHPRPGRPARPGGHRHAEGGAEQGVEHR